MNLKGTQTEKNIMTAFSSESKNRNRYTYYANVARQDGYIKIASVFDKISNQEKEHARRLFTLLNGSSVLINEGAIMSSFGSTEDNLRAAIDCEQEEQHDMYNKFTLTAKDEGFGKIAKIFESMSIAEKNHERIFKDLLQQVQKGEFFKSTIPTVWGCMNCGYRSETTSDAPFRCPACDVEQSHFEMLELVDKIFDRKDRNLS